MSKVVRKKYELQVHFVENLNFKIAKIIRR